MRGIEDEDSIEVLKEMTIAEKAWNAWRNPPRSPSEKHNNF